MTYTYEPTTSIGRCRLLVRDTAEATALFSDEDYAAFLALEGDVRLAAAAALETVASDPSKLKVLKAGSVSIDGASVSDVILKRAQLLRENAGQFDPSTGLLVGFDIAEQVVDPHSFRERIWKERLRGG